MNNTQQTSLHVQNPEELRREDRSVAASLVNGAEFKAVLLFSKEIKLFTLIQYSA